MRLFILLIAVLFVIEIKANEYQSETDWNLFKHFHKKRYVDVEEEKYRRTVYDENVNMINQHNIEADLGLHSYKLKMNQFGDMTHDEIIQTMSNKFKINLMNKISTKSDQQIFRPSSNLPIPDAVDWRKKGAVSTIIENQGQCASDWAFTATGTLEGQHFLKTGNLTRLSAQNLMDCSGKFGNQGCNGGLANAAFQYIKTNKGVDTEKSYPYEALDGKCRFNRSTVGAIDTGFVNIQRGNETALQIAIATVGPIAIAIDDTQGPFFFYESGVYNDLKCSTTELAHTLIAVGYDTFNNGTVKQDYYIVKNSWGRDWGMNGYVWLSRNKNNQCGVATRASYPLV